MVQVIRVINIAVFWPILARTGAGIDFRSAAATAWSGIRGFVGLMLALMVYVNPNIQDAVFKELCFFFMATTACLTIIVQGGIFELVLWVSINLICFISLGEHQSVLLLPLPLSWQTVRLHRGWLSRYKNKQHPEIWHDVPSKERSVAGKASEF